MAHIMKEQLDCIAVVLSKNDKTLYTKTAVNRAIKKTLFERVGWNMSVSYIANLRRGVQLNKTSAILKAKVDQLYTMLCKPRKPKPGPEEVIQQNLRIKSSTIFAEKVRAAFTTEERTEIYEKALEEKEINEELLLFEDSRNMKSDVFYERWISGKEADAYENNVWAIMYRAAVPDTRERMVNMLESIEKFPTIGASPKE